MTQTERAGRTPARRTPMCLLVALFLFVTEVATAPAAAGANPPEYGMEALVEKLELWLDQHSEHPRQQNPASIRFLQSTLPLEVTSAASAGRRERGYYSPYSNTIYLVSPWNADNLTDVSVLLHELEHHRQNGRKHWYCPGAQELPAYRLQEKWLAEHGLELDVNWIEIVLVSGCTKRDIHP